MGTAGHVDHGKSSLVEALTGIHPDRLLEEQAREMTIDLGFGWLKLPDGREVGLVDVPGHRDFIENMLAGIGGIDAVLMVVAADEGIMPQTSEHLAIIDLLGIPAGVIALTKTDLVAERERLQAIENEVKLVVQGTVLDNAPVVRVSARTRDGLGELVAAISAVLERTPERSDLGRPRLPIDRAFSMEGFGTVVTGTLVDGKLAVGDEVEILPSGRRGRIRGLQTHGRQIEVSSPGSRTAVNIAGIDTNQVRRGDVLVHKDQYRSTQRIDARLRMLADAGTPILHNRDVKVFFGASERIATVRLLGTEELFPGEQGLVQLELRNPAVCARGDMFILRRPSPAETVGGGTVLDPHPGQRHKRFDEETIVSLEAREAGSDLDVLCDASRALGPASMRDLIAKTGLTPEAGRAALRAALEENRLILLPGGQTADLTNQFIISHPAWMDLNSRMDKILQAFHSQYPLRVGMPREHVRRQLSLLAGAFNAVVAHKRSLGQLIDHGAILALSSHHVSFDTEQKAAVDQLMGQFRARPYAPPTVRECKEILGEEVLGAMKENGELVFVSDEVVFRKEDYESMVTAIRSTLKVNSSITLAEVRDLLQTSRKYAQAILEDLDRKGVTRRNGESRVLVDGNKDSGS